MPRRLKAPAIPEPQRSLESHQETLLALKEGLELVTRQRTRAVVLQSCPTWEELIELGVVDLDAVNALLK